MRRAFYWLLDQLSTYNHPAKVGAVDSLLAIAGYMLGGIASTAMRNASAPEGTSYSLNYAKTLIVGLVIGLGVGLVSASFARLLHNRPYLVRSTSRTVWGTLGAVIIPATIMWLALSIYTKNFSALSWLDSVMFFGPITAFCGYRALGFYDPNGIAELLRQGKINEAHAVMAAAAAARGMHWMP